MTDKQDKNWDAIVDQEISEEQAEESPELEMDFSNLSVEELSAKLSEMESTATENLDKFLRAQAELQNMRRRTERDIANTHKYALEKFVTELLAVLDSLEKAIETGDPHNEAAHAMLEGIGLTYKMFLDVVAKFGVEQINPAGEKFNPEYHEAITMLPGTDSDSGTIIDVVQRGYLLNNRLIRPARVVVAQ